MAGLAVNSMQEPLILLVNAMKLAEMAVIGAIMLVILACLQVRAVMQIARLKLAITKYLQELVFLVHLLL